MAASNKPTKKSAQEVQVLEGAPLLEAICDQAGATAPEGRSRIAELLDTYMAELTRGMKIGKNFTKTVNEHIAEIDRRISAQLNEVMHHAKFQKLEASWRSLQRFVKNTETNETQRIEVLDCTQAELLSDFQNAAEFTESALWKKVYQGGFGQPGADPYGMLVGDFEFGKTNDDMELLSGMARVASASHAPLITAASSTMFGMQSFTQLPDPRDLAKAFDKNNPENIKWNSFRDSEDSRYVGLCLPHVLARTPYEHNPKADDFTLQEDVDGEDHDKYLWGNAAYAFAGRVTAAFAKHHWCVAMRGVMGGGKVEDLPIHLFQSREGGVAAKCPTEVLIPDTRDNELGKLGFLPLCNFKNTDYAVFFSGQSAQRPKEYTDDIASSSAQLSAQLPHLFAVSRIAHYLKIMCRDRIGSAMSAADTQNFLQTWINQYVLLNPEGDADKKAKFPLAEAAIKVEMDPAKPGHYQAVAHLRPHFQLESLKVSLRLVAKLPTRGS